MEFTGVSRRVVLGGAAGMVALAPAGVARAAGRTDWLERHLVELRRDIHRHPEPPGEEARTAGLVAEQLRAAGLEVSTGIGGHGVVGVLTGGRPGRTVAYRADMDAVPPDNQIEGGPVTAHVCGHDLHTTIGVGVALSLARLRDRLAGTILFVFQPAEESLGGARAMLGDGVFRRARPAEIHALHCGPWPVGRFVTTGGFGFPGQDRGVVTVPDPAAATALAADIASLSTVGRPVTSGDVRRVVADFTRPHSPLARFVFLQAQAAGTQVRVTYRCWPEERTAEIRDEVRQRARKHGATAVSFPDDPFPAMVAPRPDAERLHRALGERRTLAMHAAIPYNGEDFALFLRELPGTYTFLGVRKPGRDVKTSYPHWGVFDPDERAIGHGVRAMTSWLSHRTQA